MPLGYIGFLSEIGILGDSLFSEKSYLTGLDRKEKGKEQSGYIKGSCFDLSNLRGMYMQNKLIILALLFVMTGTGMGALAEVPATEDIYIDLEKEQLYNSDMLKCGYYDDDGDNSTDPNVSLVQFDISGLNVGEDDLALLLLKANSVEKRAENLSDIYAGIALLPVASNWTEKSDINSLVSNLKPSLDGVKETPDFARMGIGLDNGDNIFAFDVSQNIREAEGDEISFLLIAFGKNMDYFVDFASRETGDGPYLLILSYPSMVSVIPGDGLPMDTGTEM